MNDIQLLRFLSKNTKQGNGYRVSLLCQVFPFLVKEVDDWEQDDIRAFLESFGMEKEMKLLFEHDFKTGFVLKAAEREDARHMGISLAAFAKMNRWMDNLEETVKKFEKQVFKRKKQRNTDHWRTTRRRRQNTRHQKMARGVPTQDF